MLSYFDLRKGVNFILENQPWEVLEFQQIYKAQDMVVARTKIINLISGKVLEKTFRQSDTFEEAELEKIEVKFVYLHRGSFFFSEARNPSKRLWALLQVRDVAVVAHVAVEPEDVVRLRRLQDIGTILDTAPGDPA